jgi:poly(3-hydroxybutyrate) depolymerase
MRPHLALIAAISVIAPALTLTGCAGPLHSKPGTYEARTVPVKFAGRDLRVTYVTPTTPRTTEVVVLFASGDAGYWGVSTAIMAHLAEQSYYLVTYDARQLIAREKKSHSRTRIREMAAFYDTILVDARRSHGIPDRVPVLATGYSRGANMVVLAAGIDSLRRHLAGAVAIALCPNTDYVETPTPADPLSDVLVDEQGHLQTYAAIPSAGSLPFAVIQGTKDSYIGAEKARQLFGPDTPRRRFYTIEGGHTFGGARDTLMRDLDDALGWIQGIAGGN